MPQPTLLFFNDFPPSNANGGSVLIKRLLAGYPRENLVAVTRSEFSAGNSEPPQWCNRLLVLPGIKETGRWGVARVKGLLNWLLIPVVAYRATRFMRLTSASAVLSVSSGTYFLSAALASSWTKVPLVMIVHDDWVPPVAAALHLPQRWFHYLLGLALRQASHVFAVSEGMRQKLKALYRVESEIQMPATDPWNYESGPEMNQPGGVLRILYMGNGVAAQDSLDLLIAMIRKKTLARYGLHSVELHLCTPWRTDDDPAIRHHGWMSETDARRQIASSDILFLPYSFTDEDRPITTASFPAKGADYLASAKAIVVIGPWDSTTVQYAEQYHYAEIVTELDEDALARAICRLALEEDHRGNLSANALRAFNANHNIARQQERLCEVIRGLAVEK